MRCSAFLIVVGAAIAATACKTNSEPIDEQWTRVPLDRTVEGKVGDISYSLRVPAKFVHWRNGGQEFWSSADKNFYVKLVVDPAGYLDFTAFNRDAFAKDPDIWRRDLDGFVLVAGGQALHDGTSKLLSKHDTPDGYAAAFQASNPDEVLVDSVKLRPHTLYCGAHAGGGGHIANPAATAAWLEQLCASVEIH